MGPLARMGRVSAFLASLAMLVPPAVLRAADTGRATRVVDISLDAHGSLHGAAVDELGAPLVQQVVLLDDGREQVMAETDSEGRFQFDGLQGGSYSVQAGGQAQMCRAWKAGTAPPAAKRQVVLTGYCDSIDPCCGAPVGCGTPVGCPAPLGRMRQALHDPIIVGGILAAAIAIPLAIDDDGDDPAS